MFQALRRRERNSMLGLSKSGDAGRFDVVTPVRAPCGCCKNDSPTRKKDERKTHRFFFFFCGGEGGDSSVRRL